MEETYITLVKQNNLVINKCNQKLEEYKQCPIKTQAEIGKQAVVKVEVLSETVKGLAEMVYERDVENDALREQLGDVDEKRIKSFYRTETQKVVQGESQRIDKLKIELQRKINKNIELQSISKK